MSRSIEDAQYSAMYELLNHMSREAKLTAEQYKIGERFIVAAHQKRGE